MALQDVDVPINLTGGLDTKTDPKQVVTGRLLSLQNARYKTLDSYIKRNGYTALSTGILGGGNISNGVGLASFQNQLNLYDGSSFYSYNASTANWVNKGPLLSLNFSANPVIKNSNSQTSNDSAYNAGLTAYVWEDSSGGIRYSVVDQVTSDPIVDNQAVLATASNPRVAAIGVYLVVVYVNASGQLAYKSINTATPETLSSETVITSDLSTTYRIFDVSTIGAHLYVGYTNSTPAIAFYSLSTALVLSAQYTVGTDFETAISLTGDASNNVWASYYNGTAVKTLVVNSALNSTVLAPTVVETLPLVNNVTSLVTGTTAEVLYDETINYINSVTETVTASTAGNTVENISFGFGSIPQVIYDQPFVANLTGALAGISVDLFTQSGQYVSVYAGTGTVNICADNSGVPGTVLATATFPGSDINQNSGAPTIVAISGATLTQGTLYHLEIDLSAVTNPSTPSQVDRIVLGAADPIPPPQLAGMYFSGGTWHTIVECFFYNVEISLTVTTSTPYAPPTTIIRQNTMTIGGAAGTPDTLIRSVGLVSKAFGYNGMTWIACTYPSSLQGKYFLINSAGQQACRYSGEPNLGGGLTAKNLLPSVNFLATNNYQISYTQVDQITQSPQVIDGILSELASTQTGVVQGLFNFQSGTFTSLSLGNNLNLTGGLPSIYDGNNVVEQGMNLYPENLLGSILNTGGALSSGQYQYAITYEWLDNQGQVVRSAPSVAYTILPGQSQYLSGALTTTTEVTAATGSNLSQIYIGQGITDQLAQIPVNTSISSNVNTSGQFTIDNAAAATEAVDTFDLQSSLQLYANFVIANNSSSGLNTLRINQLQYLPVMADYTNTSNVMQLVNPVVAQYLCVGMTVNDASGALSGSSNTAVITAINTATGQITLNQTATDTINNSISTISNQITATINSTQNVTVTSYTAQQLAALQTNDRVYSPDLTGGLSDLVTYSGGTAFSFQQLTASTSGSVTMFIGIDIRAFLAVGQTVTGVGTTSGILGTGIIASLVGGPETETTSVVVFTTQVITGAYTGNNVPDTTATLNNLYQINLVIPTLRVTNKQGVNIVIYRTAANGTIFYKIATIPNSTTIDFIQYLDGTSDYTALDRDELYTTGGQVINIAAPPTNLAVQYNNRDIIVPVENPFSFWYSEQVIPGTPVQFSDEFINNIDARGGGMTSVGVMDDKLIMFKENLIFYLVAQGPGLTGANNDFNAGTQVVTPVGCSNQKSVVSMPNGLMFQASGGQGIWLLTRDLGTQYVGADVEAYNGYTVTSTQLDPTATEVRFTLSNGTFLIYDYFVGKWSVDLNLSGADSCIFGNLYTYLNANGTAYQEAPGTYTDNGAFIPLGLTTSWLSFADLQGFQRVREFLILGEYFSPHMLSVGFAYNFNNTIVQTDNITVSSDPNPYQFRSFLQVQKCQAVQITLLESQSGSYGQGLSLSGFNFIIGKKKGHFKMPAAASYG